MRNPPQAVDEVTRARTIRLAKRLASLDAPVTLKYVKRNGEVSMSTGPVVGFSGTVGDKKFSVILDTFATKGRPSTINLDGVREVL